MTPSIGRIVIYRPTYNEKKLMELQPMCNVQDELPAVVVKAWNETTVNLRVITDGTEDLWVTSSVQGDGEGNWQWPDRK